MQPSSLLSLRQKMLFLQDLADLSTQMPTDITRYSLTRHDPTRPFIQEHYGLR
uniref:Uncharacterized protein n=1 Tax=Romanomermis culicivorax TaxID=13658 RepID=A0A915HYN4_ROMCU